MAYITEIKRPTIYGYYSRKTSSTSTLETFRVARGLGGFVVSHDVPALPRPKGFKPPKPYRKYGQDDDRYGLRSVYAIDTNPSTGVYKYHYGVDTGNSLICDLSPFDETVATKAVISARLNLKGQKVNFAQAFAEREQTAALVLDVAKRLAGAYRSARKGDLRGIANSLGVPVIKDRRARRLAQYIRNAQGKGQLKSVDLNNVHNLVLAHRYGIMPLLSDVYGSAQLLAEKDLGDPQRYKSYVKGSASSSSKTRTVFDGQVFSNQYGARLTTTTRKTWKAMVRLDVHLDNPALASLTSAGFTNPAALVWELLPGSFIADWFVPIADYLNGLDAGNGWIFTSGSISRKSEGSSMVRVSNNPNEVLAKGQFRFITGYGMATAYDLDRRVYTSLPLPTSLFPKNPFSGAHVTAAVALLMQAVGKSH